MRRLAAVLLTATLTLAGLACADERADIAEIPPSTPTQAVETAEPAPTPEATPVASSTGQPEGRMAPASAGTAADDDASRIEAHILDVFGTTRALCIAALESTGQRGHYDLNAVGRASEIGLFQLLPSVHRYRWTRRGWTDADMFDLERNTAIAHEIWSQSGWRPWTVRGRC